MVFFKFRNAVSLCLGLSALLLPKVYAARPTAESYNALHEAAKRGLPWKDIALINKLRDSLAPPLPVDVANRLALVQKLLPAWEASLINCSGPSLYFVNELLDALVRQGASERPEETSAKIVEAIKAFQDSKPESFKEPLPLEAQVKEDLRGLIEKPAMEQWPLFMEDPSVVAVTKIIAAKLPTDPATLEHWVSSVFGETLSVKLDYELGNNEYFASELLRELALQGEMRKKSSEPDSEYLLIKLIGG